MVTLRELAYDALGNVAVYIGEPYNYPGTVWNTGETAFVRVTITNNTGLTLRDVVATLRVYGAGEVYPWHFMCHNMLDGEASWDELQPYQSRYFIVRLRGRAAGTARMYAYIEAEIVPYASRHRATRFASVTAA